MKLSRRAFLKSAGVAGATATGLTTTSGQIRSSVTARCSPS